MKIFGVFLSSSFTSTTKANISMRLLMLVWSIGSLLLSSAYSSGLVGHLTVGNHNLEINTIKDMVENNIIWGLPYQPTFTWDDFDKENIYQQRLLKSFVLERDPALKRERLYSKTYAVQGSLVGTELFLRPAKNNPPEDDGIWEQMKILQECTFNVYMTFALRKRSPFLKHFNRLLDRFHSTGLLAYWQKNVIIRRRHPAMRSWSKGQSNNSGVIGALTLNHLKGAFLSLGIGLIFSFLCFLIELKYSSMQKTFSGLKHSKYRA